MEEHENDTDKLRELETEFADIRYRLEALCSAGKITEFVKRALIELIKEGLLSLAEAAKRLKMSEEELKKYL